MAFQRVSKTKEKQLRRDKIINYTYLCNSNINSNSYNDNNLYLPIFGL